MTRTCSICWFASGGDADEHCGRCACCALAAADQMIYESHTWNPADAEHDEECIVCGITWGECENACPDTDTHRQAAAGEEPSPLLSPAVLPAAGTPAGRPGGVKSLPLTFWWMRSDRKARAHIDDGWAEVGVLGWSVGVAWR